MGAGTGAEGWTFVRSAELRLRIGVDGSSVRCDTPCTLSASPLGVPSMLQSRSLVVRAVRAQAYNCSCRVADRRRARDVLDHWSEGLPAAWVGEH